MQLETVGRDVGCIIISAPSLLEKAVLGLLWLRPIETDATRLGQGALV